MTVYFLALMFDTTYGASEALNKVRAAAELGYTWVDDIAIKRPLWQGSCDCFDDCRIFFFRCCGASPNSDGCAGGKRFTPVV